MSCLKKFKFRFSYYINYNLLRFKKKNNNYNNNQLNMYASCFPPGQFYQLNTSSILNSPCASGALFNYPNKVLEKNRLIQVNFFWIFYF